MRDERFCGGAPSDALADTRRKGTRQSTVDFKRFKRLAGCFGFDAMVTPELVLATTTLSSPPTCAILPLPSEFIPVFLVKVTDVTSTAPNFGSVGCEFASKLSFTMSCGRFGIEWMEMRDGSFSNKDPSDAFAGIWCKWTRWSTFDSERFKRLAGCFDFGQIVKTTLVTPELVFALTTIASCQTITDFCVYSSDFGRRHQWHSNIVWFFMIIGIQFFCQRFFEQVNPLVPHWLVLFQSDSLVALMYHLQGFHWKYQNHLSNFYDFQSNEFLAEYFWTIFWCYCVILSTLAVCFAVRAFIFFVHGIWTS